MILFFFGEETFGLREKRLALKKTFFEKNPGSSGFFEFDLAEPEANLRSILENLDQKGLFAIKKFLVIGRIFDAPIETRRALAEILDARGAELAADTDRILLFFQGGTPRKNEKLWKSLSVKHIRQEVFDPLSPARRTRWIMERAILYGASGIDADSVRLLSTGFLLPVKKNERVRHPDLFRLDAELRKLGSFRKGEVIHREDVELLSMPEAEEASVFMALDALFGGDRLGAIRAFLSLAKEDGSLGLLGMCAWQLRAIVRTRLALDKGRIRTSNEVARLLGMHPFAAEKCFRIAGRSTTSDLERLSARLTILDREAKSGDRTPEDALTAFVMG